MRHLTLAIFAAFIAFSARAEDTPLNYAHGFEQGVAHPDTGGCVESCWNDPKLYNWPLHQEFMGEVDKALGRFDDIPVFEWNGQKWDLLNGKYIPVTVDGVTPDCFDIDGKPAQTGKLCYKDNLKSDRPMLLPIRVEEFQGGDGQSNPFTVVGRMPGTNPEVQWIFLVRKYYVKEPTDKDFDISGDMAIIGHHPRTGASVFFQFYDPANPKSGKTVVSPFSGEAGMRFWSPLVTQAKVFKCERCHAADPFLHSPWINQVRVGGPMSEPMVPSDPLGPYFFIDVKAKNLFSTWDYSLHHLDNRANQCTECHRVTPYDLAGLYQNSTVFNGLDPAQYNQFAKEAHFKYQTEAFSKRHWMPPVYPNAFYTDQDEVADVWQDNYGTDASDVNRLSKIGNKIIVESGNIQTKQPACEKNPTPECKQEIAKYEALLKEAEAELTKVSLKPVPAPPEEYRSIMVARPNVDTVAPGKAIAIIDSRMRANTDGNLTEWRFVAQAAAEEGMLVMPAVFRDVTGSGGLTDDFEIVHLGDVAQASDAEGWLPISQYGQFDLKQGDFLGVFLINESGAPGKGVIPFTTDDWAKITAPDGTTRLPKGYVTYRLELDQIPGPGGVLKFEDADYLTYSFEMKNTL